MCALDKKLGASWTEEHLVSREGIGVFRETRIWFGGGIRGAFVMAASPVLLGEIFFSCAKLCL